MSLKVMKACRLLRRKCRRRCSFRRCCRGRCQAGAMADIVFYSAGCFESILLTRERDVRLLMQGVTGGLGPRQPLPAAEEVPDRGACPCPDALHAISGFGPGH